ncbi:unnamed protein product [Sphagnum tenellum]
MYRAVTLDLPRLREAGSSLLYETALCSFVCLFGLFLLLLLLLWRNNSQKKLRVSRLPPPPQQRLSNRRLCLKNVSSPSPLSRNIFLFKPIEPDVCTQVGVNINQVFVLPPKAKKKYVKMSDLKSVSKYFLFFINCVTFICGLVLLFIGVVLQTQYSSYFDFLEGSFLSVSVWCIVMGVVVAAVSFLGLYGAIREDYRSLLAFSVCLGVVICLEIALGISALALANEDKLAKSIGKRMAKSLEAYNQTGHEGVTKDGLPLLRRRLPRRLGHDPLGPPPAQPPPGWPAGHLLPCSALRGGERQEERRRAWRRGVRRWRGADPAALGRGAPGQGAQEAGDVLAVLLRKEKGFSRKLILYKLILLPKKCVALTLTTRIKRSLELRFILG